MTSPELREGRFRFDVGHSRFSNRLLGLDILFIDGYLMYVLSFETILFHT